MYDSQTKILMFNYKSSFWYHWRSLEANGGQLRRFRIQFRICMLNRYLRVVAHLLILNIYLLHVIASSFLSSPKGDAKPVFYQHIQLAIHLAFTCTWKWALQWSTFWLPHRLYVNFNTLQTAFSRHSSLGKETKTILVNFGKLAVSKGLSIYALTLPMRPWDIKSLQKNRKREAISWMESRKPLCSTLF